MVGYGTAATALARSRGGWCRPEPFPFKDGSNNNTSPPASTPPPSQIPRETVVLSLGVSLPERASLPTVPPTGPGISVPPPFKVTEKSSLNNAAPSTRVVDNASGVVLVLVSVLVVERVELQSSWVASIRARRAFSRL